MLLLSTERPQEVLNNVLNGEARPAPGPNTYTLLYNILERKGAPFVYLSLTNGTEYPFHIASHLTVVNTPFLKCEQIAKLENFLHFSQP